MLIHRGAVYRRALTTNVPSWERVWELFLSEPSTYETALDEAEEAREWVREHQNMTPEESVENEFRGQYEEMVEYLLPDLHDKDCYRAVGVDERKCTAEEAVRIDPLGIYWSEHSEFAETYWNYGEPECVFIYRARIDAAHINVLETLTVRLHNPDEFEVRFNEGASLYVYDCMIEREGRWSSEEGAEEKVSIEEMRTC